LPERLVSGPRPSRGACEGCGADIRADEVAIDVLPEGARADSLGAAAMQSAWIARVYEKVWRPLAFGLSTGFGAPRVSKEVGIVADKIAEMRGPWLDLSCGPGTATRVLVARAGKRAVVGVDLSRAMLVRAHAAAPAALLVRADAAALPFRDGSFGAVVNLAALDLYADPARVIAESARVLAPGGRWVVSTFVAGRGGGGRSARSRWSGVRTPTLEEVEHAASAAGLKAFASMPFRRYAVAWADKA
jgi:ubiquinone/menaquinone biosynthesis C-methylase UbiE